MISEDLVILKLKINKWASKHLQVAYLIIL